MVSLPVVNPATSGDDYDPTVDSVTLYAPVGSGTFTLSSNVTLFDDTILEFGEEFTVFLDASNPPFGVTITASDTTTVSLGDDGKLLFYI